MLFLVIASRGDVMRSERLWAADSDDAAAQLLGQLGDGWQVDSCRRDACCEHKVPRPADDLVGMLA
jgi:hypothetical protein